MSEAPFLNRRILVVDDEERMVRFIRLNLEHDGFQVVEAFNSQQAMDKLRETLQLRRRQLVEKVLELQPRRGRLAWESSAPGTVLTLERADGTEVFKAGTPIENAQVPDHVPSVQGNGPCARGAATRISRDMVRDWAGTVGLPVADDALEALTVRVDRMLASLGQLDELPLEGIEPNAYFNVPAPGEDPTCDPVAG